MKPIEYVTVDQDILDFLKVIYFGTVANRCQQSGLSGSQSHYSFFLYGAGGSGRSSANGNRIVASRTSAFGF